MKKIKNLVFLLFVTLLVSSCTKTIDYDKEKEYFNEENEVFYYKGSPFNGVLIRNYDEKQIRISKSYEDGKLNGPWEVYYENGQLKYKSNYKHGKEDGLSERYYENGQLKVRRFFSDNYEVGDVERYFENGQLEEKTIYNDENSLFPEIKFPELLLNYKLNNSECSNLDLEGDIDFYRDYKNSLKITGDHWGGSILNTLINFQNKKQIEILIIHEVWQENYFSGVDTLNLNISKNGDVFLIRNNKKQDYLSCYNGSSTPLQLKRDEIEILDKYTVEQYYENGQLKSNKTYINNRLNGLSAEYSKNGQLFYKRNYKDGYQFGLYESYFENGKLSVKCEKFESQYGMIVYIGDYKSYHSNGNLSYSTNYNNNGEEDGFSERYHDNKQLQYSVNFVNGKEEGPSKSYFENGDLENELNWSNGKETGIKYDRDGCGFKIKIFMENGKTVDYQFIDEEGKQLSQREYSLRGCQ